jgi:diguanylate cyclase (GGDEF)-like protein
MEKAQPAATRILIVDDSANARLLIESMLRAQGYSELTSVDSAQKAFERLGLDEAGTDGAAEFDLVLMDLMMEGIDGLEASRRIKSCARFADMPLIMVTAEDSAESLKEAFEAGAMDYIKKPVNRVELMARVQSALRLKQETVCRKARELELIELTRKLERLSNVDGLTGIANRRHFDNELARAWRRGQRAASPVALILIDIDHFKSFNDRYGHLAGDDCLRRVAQVLAQTVKRPFDLVARYGGEEFVVLLPDTHGPGAGQLAEEMRATVAALTFTPGNGHAACGVTCSAGAATVTPEGGMEPAGLIARADACLYQAKREGRNRVIIPAEELSHA